MSVNEKSTKAELLAHIKQLESVNEGHKLVIQQKVDMCKQWQKVAEEATKKAKTVDLELFTAEKNFQAKVKDFELQLEEASMQRNHLITVAYSRACTDLEGIQE